MITKELDECSINQEIDMKAVELVMALEKAVSCIDRIIEIRPRWTFQEVGTSTLGCKRAEMAGIIRWAKSKRD